MALYISFPFIYVGYETYPISERKTCKFETRLTLSVKAEFQYSVFMYKKK